MISGLVVRLCAPTLAGLKLGNLFTYQFDCSHELQYQIDDFNRELNEKDVYFEIVRLKSKSALIYVYRKKKLQAALDKAEIRDFLRAYNYDDFSIEASINTLKSNLLSSDFPHEIGIFLDYPLEDVRSFIEHKGANSELVGHWKVYHNVDEARNTFCKYDKCTRLYCERHSQGVHITRLAVAV